MSYTIKPDWLADSKNSRGNVGVLTVATKSGWVQPAGGQPTLGITTIAGNGASITITPDTNPITFGIVVGQEFLVAGVATTDAYNNIWTVSSVTSTTIVVTSTVTGVGVTTNAVLSRGWEVIECINSLDKIYADALVAVTFTAPVTNAVANVLVTADVITITLTPSEPIIGDGGTIGITLGTDGGGLMNRTATFVNKVGENLIYEYTILSTDIPTLTTGRSVATTTVGDNIREVLDNGNEQAANVTFTPTAILAWTINGV